MTEEEKEALMHFLFEDKSSEKHSAGKLVIEGTHTAAYFRNPKAYILLKDLDQPSTEATNIQRYVRMKGIPKSIREALHTQFFCQDVSKNSCNIRTVSLRGTLGHEMVLLRESKNLSHCFNFKRIMNVSPFVLKTNEMIISF